MVSRDFFVSEGIASYDIKTLRGSVCLHIFSFPGGILIPKHMNFSKSEVVWDGNDTAVVWDRV